MNDLTVFVDANVLIYVALSNSAFHQVARQQLISFAGSGKVLCISNQVIREYLSGMSRTLLNARQYDAIRLANDVYMMQRQYTVLEETICTRQNLLNLLGRFTTGGKQVHDANIVATMQQYGITQLLTNNVDDFKRFDSLITLIPLIEQA